MGSWRQVWPSRFAVRPRRSTRSRHQSRLRPRPQRACAHTAFTLIHSTCIANDIRNHSHRNASVSSASESLSLSFFAIMVTNPLNVT